MESKIIWFLFQFYLRNNWYIYIVISKEDNDVHIKKCFENIIRNKGRNVLIGIIILVIANASSITLAIRESANDIIKAHKENNCVIIVTHSTNVCDNVDKVYELKKINRGVLWKKK